MLIIIKVFIILFLLMGIGNNLEIFKVNSKLSFEVSVQVCFLLGQTEGERKAFFEGCKKGGHYLQEDLVVIGHEKVSPFVKLILPLFSILLDHLINKDCRT